jgi:hypothetical protein
LKGGGGGRAVAADHDPVRACEVGDGGAFLEEFRIADHRELDLHGALVELDADGRAHLLRRAHRHGRLVDHHQRAGHALAEAARRRQDVGQVRAAVLVGRGADRQEHHVGVLDRFVIAGREQQPARLGVARDQRVEAGFMDRDAAVLEHGDLALVHVQAQHGIADVREAGAGHQADIAGADNRNFHRGLPMRGAHGWPLPLFLPATPLFLLWQA